MLAILDLFQTLVIHAVVFAFGLMLWVVGEYWVHTVLCHHRKLKWASKIHWDHHKIIGGIEKARLDAEAYGKFTPVLIAFVVMPFLWVMFSLFLGFEYGFTLTMSFVVAYWHYEYVHWRIHCRTPRNRYEQKMLEHHFAHHYCDPKRYQSVSMPAIDHFFGTMPSPEKQAEHFEKIRSKEPLNSEDNIWAWLHAFTTKHRKWPENYQPPEAKAVPAAVTSGAINTQLH